MASEEEARAAYTQLTQCMANYEPFKNDKTETVSFGTADGGTVTVRVGDLQTCWVGAPFVALAAA
jgi:hypothetical protein